MFRKLNFPKRLRKKRHPQKLSQTIPKLNSFDPNNRCLEAFYAANPTAVSKFGSDPELHQCTSTLRL